MIDWDGIDLDRVLAPFGGAANVVAVLDRMGPIGALGAVAGGVVSFTWRRRRNMAKDETNVTALPGRNDALIGKILETTHEKLAAFQPPVASDPAEYDRRALWRSVFDRGLNVGYEPRTGTVPDVTEERITAAADLATLAVQKFDAVLGAS